MDFDALINSNNYVEFFKFKNTVITSYSIHYTKLYEENPFWWQSSDRRIFPAERPCYFSGRSFDRSCRFPLSVFSDHRRSKHN